MITLLAAGLVAVGRPVFNNVIEQRKRRDWELGRRNGLIMVYRLGGSFEFHCHVFVIGVSDLIRSGESHSLDIYYSFVDVSAFLYIFWGGR